MKISIPGCLGVFWFLLSAQVMAAPALPQVLTVTQTDGSSLKVRERGDEWQSWVETLDGFTVAKSNDGNWYYVLGFRGQKPVLSNIKAGKGPVLGVKKHLAPQRITLPSGKVPVTVGRSKNQIGLKTHTAPVTSTRSNIYDAPILYLLIDFNDQAATVPAAHWNDLAAQVEDYFRFNSFGKANFVRANETHGTGNDGIVGWLRLNRNHPNESFPNYLMNEAIRAADPYVDFSQFDRDGDGHLYTNELAVVLVVAGYSSGVMTPAIHAHRSATTDELVDGVYIGASIYNLPYKGGYAMVAEYWSDTTNPDTVGVLLHELGHLLFDLPDLYRGIYNGIGMYGLMGVGYGGKKQGDLYTGMTPVNMSGFSRDYLGWTEGTQVTSGQISLTAAADATASPSNAIFKVMAANGSEYFIIENRQNVGYDQGLQTSLGNTFQGGLAIWHVNPNNPFNSDTDFPLVDIEQVGTANDALLDFPTDAHFWRSTTQTSFDAASVPSSLHHDGSDSGVVINNISADGLVMTVTVGGSVVTLPPVARPGGPYSALVGELIQFDGSGSTDSDGLSLTYQWDFGDGATATGVNPQHSYSIAGTYTVSLVVNNGSLDSTAVTTLATISDGNNKPVANVGGPYSGVVDGSIVFDASASSDVDGDTLSYHWDFGDGTSATGVSVTHAYTVAATYTVSLVVNDGQMDSDPSVTQVTVTDPVGPPVADPGGPYQTVTGKYQFFNGSASSDPAGRTLSYYWDFGDGATATGISPYHVYRTPGRYVISLRVNNGVQDSVLVQTPIEVHANIASSPVAVAGGPYEVYAGGYLGISANQSIDPYGRVLTFYWDFGNGDTATGSSPLYAYYKTGTYKISLVADNGSLRSETATTTVTVRPNPYQSPVPRISSALSSIVGRYMSFDASQSTDPLARVLTYEWDFGDGVRSSRAVTSHAYAQAGEYQLTLTVSNGVYTTVKRETVNIGPNPFYAPTAVLTGAQSGLAGEPLNFSAAGSSDPQGRNLQYRWKFSDGSFAEGISVRHGFQQPGIHQVNLTVSNGAALSEEKTLDVEVAANPVLTPSVSIGGPYTGVSGNYVFFGGISASDPQGKKLVYEWDFGDGHKGFGANPYHAYVIPGLYAVTLTVDNGTYRSAVVAGIVSVSANIANSPTARPGGPYTTYQDWILPFDGRSSSDPNGKKLIYYWDFGDGTLATGPYVGKRYTATGSYTASLVVSNGRYASVPASVTVTVLPNPFQ